MHFGIDIQGVTTGQTVADIQHVLAKADADWAVTLLPAAAVFPDGSTVIVPSSRFVVAGNEPVGQVGSRYHPVQNGDTLQFSWSIADHLGCSVTRVGVTQGRRRFWCWIPLESAGLLVSTTHHGRGSVSVQAVIPSEGGLVRVGVERDAVLSFPHGPTLQSRLASPGAVASWANDWLVWAGRERERLKSLLVSADQLAQVLEGVAPTDRVRTARQEQNRHAVLDAVAGRWVAVSPARDGWSLLEAVAWYLDAGRPGRWRDREDQSVDDASWVTRAKVAVYSAVSSL